MEEIIEEINKLASQWEEGVDITLRDALLIYESLEDYLEHEFGQISKLTTDANPETALGELVKMTNFLSAAGNQVPGIVRKLQKKMQKYQGLTSQIGKQLGANSVTISVGFPAGVTVSLTWTI